MKRMRNAVLGVGNKDPRGYLVREERVNGTGELSRRIMERPPGGSPFNAQTKINAFNFPYTLNPGSGCFFQCRYCYLRQPFFQRHVAADHGREMSYLPNLSEVVAEFLKAKKGLPQYMKRVQAGVSTEMFMPAMTAYTHPDKVLQAFQTHGVDWMLHMVTKSPEILKYAEILAEMKSQVQVEVSFVTLDEKASRIFEAGTPSVAQRLKIVETLAKKGVFVRMMMMPVMREYDLQVVDTHREIVFANAATGERRPGRKPVSRVDGNCGAGEHPVELWDGKRWQTANPTEKWSPVVHKDWSNVAQAQAHWRSYGASAYKQKDLNYFFVDELLAAQRKDRAPIAERGRTEDPTAEQLVHSGETVRDTRGADVFVKVRGLHMSRKHWPKTAKGNDRVRCPSLQRRMMDFGYRLHSKIDWIDCV